MAHVSPLSMELPSGAVMMPILKCLLDRWIS